MKLKPIEPGCNAIITTDHNGNRGKHVIAELLIPSDGVFTVGDLEYTNLTASRGARVWKVSGGSLSVKVDGKIQKAGWTTVGEKELMRIDGEDFSDEDNPYAVKDKEETHG